MADAVGPVFTEPGVEPLGARRLRQPETLLDIEPPLRGAPTHELGEPGLGRGPELPEALPLFLVKPQLLAPPLSPPHGRTPFALFSWRRSIAHLAY
jgi:hypothetical protein